jgi:predicted TIM-barrel fold metal-dependent hydrolase
MDRRKFLTASATALAALPGVGPRNRACGAPSASSLVIDAHMHVWANDPRRYPYSHPYVNDFQSPPHEATLEMLLADLDQHHCTYCVLVQTIYHGWDNRYIADCIGHHPGRFKAHGLIDPTDAKVAEKLEYWTKEHGLRGMRFSPIYYQQGRHGGDSWLAADTSHRLWRKAEELGSVFNFFISARQLPALAKMVQAHPDVPVVIDHLAQIDLGADDPEPDVRLLLAMARFPNVWVKVSELTSVSKSHRYPFRDAYPCVQRVYEAFGPDRLLFGTGYPGAARAAYGRPTLAQEIDLIAEQMPFLSGEDREKILGRNAARLWGFVVEPAAR